MNEDDLSPAPADNAPAPDAEEELAAHVIEGARSNRSKCKTCRRKIDKGALRIGILIEGPYGTGYMWHHLKCAAKRQFDEVKAAYEAEAWNEAKEPPADVPPLESLEKLKTEAEERKAERRELPYVELAPSARSKCKQCGEGIDKGAARVVLGRQIEFGRQVRTSPVNVHPGCVAAEIGSEDCAHPADQLQADLRRNSADLGPVMDEVLSEIGEL